MPRPGGGGRSGRGGRGSGRGGGGGDRSGDRGGGNRGGAGAGDRGGGGNRGGARRQQQPLPQAVRELEITDEKIFPRLLDAGLDLGQEAVIEAFLYFTGEGAARRVAAQLEEGGFTTYVDPSPPGRWLLEAVSRAVPTPEHIASMGTGLRNLARSNNGSYDGWWATEPPEEDEADLATAGHEEGANPAPYEAQVAPEPVIAAFDEESKPVPDQVREEDQDQDRHEPVAGAPEVELEPVQEKDSPGPV